MKQKRILLALTTSLVLSIAVGTANARDTDIYFLDSSGAGNLVKPNLLLILDTSGSMNEDVSGTTLSRVDVMKQSMLTVLDELSNANVGLMRFSNDAGGPVLFPATDIDATVTNTGNVQVVVQDSVDDAQEIVSSGAVTLTGSRIYLNSDGSNQTIAGLRFRNFYVPQGVTITSAKIVFKADNDNSGTVDLQIRADKTEEAPIYAATTNNISGRTQTTSYVDWNNVSSWTTDSFNATPDITNVVQEVVSQSEWCYGNSIAFTFKRNGGNTGRREARAYDTFESDGFAAPVASLVVTYNPSTVPTGSGCFQFAARVQHQNDDAEERISTGSMSMNTVMQLGRTNSSTPNTAQHVGVRFRDLKIPQGATIKSAFLEFEVDTTNSSTSSLTIVGESNDNASIYSSSAGDISGRSTTSASVTSWSPPNSAVNQRLVSPDVSSIVQEIVNRSGWASGNALAFRVSGTGTRNVESFDTEPAAAPLLRVRYSAGTAWTKTTRDQLKEFIVAMRAESNTPIVDSLYEAARYYRGEGVDYGLRRDGQTGTLAQWTRVSHPSTYTGGTLYTPPGCSAADPDSASCVTEEIQGSPTYITPIAYSCQSNHMVLLTDGAPNGNSAATKIQTMTGASSCSGSGDTACGVTLTNFLYTQDQNSIFGDPQNVRTHTVGLDISNTFLADLASNGGGLYKTATDSTGLVAAFNSILNEVIKDPTSFVSPSLSVNAFNRLYNRDEIYFTLFSPQLTVAWPGNVKKYKLCSQSGASATCTFGDVLDVTDASAIDPVTAKIRSTSQSYWSGSVDGPDVQVGGAGEQIGIDTGRRVYTYTGTSSTPATPVDLSGSSHVVTTTNAALTQAMLGTSSSTERDDIINWMRGKDLEDENSDGLTTDNRWKFADALHSRPTTVTYGGTSANPVIKLLVGTNDGGVRMVDVASGQEDWIVYLPEFLSTQRTLKANGSNIHIAGVDGSPTVRVVDNDNDGIIEPSDGDKVQLFIGMRRGGSDIYAFDITPPSVLTTSSALGTVKPKLMWRIKGGTGSFANLGQTWSRPQLASVWVECDNASCDDGVGTTNDSKLTTVLMFAGGYDTNFDDTIPTGTDGYGNAIYMVNPDTGARIWWASGSGSGADLELSNMKYSIPSDLALYDSNQDSAVDRIFVGDTRGQLWRLDLSNQIDPTGSTANQRNGGAPGSGGSNGYVFADIGCTGGSRSNNCSATSNQNHRSFFYPPDIAQVRDQDYSATAVYDYITIATGDREDPLDKKTPSVDPIYNRIYAFRDVNTNLGSPASTPSALAESNLYPATSNILQDTSNAGYAAALAALQGSSGWYIDLSESTSPNWIGEKSLARTTIFAGVLYVTTYTPPQASVVATPCASPAEGTAKVYGLNLLNATGAIYNTTNRSQTVGGGIPSELVVIIREGGSSGLVGTSGGGKVVDVAPGLPQTRTYWYQE